MSIIHKLKKLPLLTKTPWQTLKRTTQQMSDEYMTVTFPTSQHPLIYIICLHFFIHHELFLQSYSTSRLS